MTGVAGAPVVHNENLLAECFVGYRSESLLRRVLSSFSSIQSKASVLIQTRHAEADSPQDGLQTRAKCTTGKQGAPNAKARSFFPSNKSEYLLP